MIKKNNQELPSVGKVDTEVLMFAAANTYFTWTVIYFSSIITVHMDLLVTEI